ncbi:LAMI_0H09252g1_1 [Lachancea mirantina]|uniref:Nucleolar complex-associated protein 3 n=1 Tax=Lachancea mirantina TaxID=1230905 RepID=A0A1G4KGE9_9SACH|nr:LAMI_0H09252g1_1 [Lachancea mirantina]
MGKNKRSRGLAQERLAKRRKEDDALLENGLFLQEDVGNLEDKIPTDKQWEDEEQDYELQPRKIQDYDEDLVEGLPVKVKGKILRQVRSVARPNGKSTQNETDEDLEETEVKHEVNEASDEEDEHSPSTDNAERILKLKEEIADLVELLMEEVEENIAALTRLRKMAQSKNPNTCKFSMLALVSVFKSLIPSYKIRPLTDLERKEKVSKEVAKQRNFEQTLVSNYKLYLDLLTTLAKTPNNADTLQVSLGGLAAIAAAELATSTIHFNFRTELLTILIRRACKPSASSDVAYSKIVQTLETLMNDDGEGSVSLEVLRIMSKVLKTRKFMIDESVLNIFLSLDVLHDYDPNTKVDQPVRRKIKKSERVHLSKKQRKARKETKQIEDEMRKAEQVVSAEERERNQAEILKILLSLYLTLLRENKANLVGSVLEGLAKFGHMANFDLLGDFLEVMKEIIETSHIDELSFGEVRKILLCIVTAFSLISNHTHMKVSVDLSSFVQALYALLPTLSQDADIEFSHKSLRLADPLNDDFVKPSVNVSTKAELLLKALDHIFFRSRSGSKDRAAAFVKRLYMMIENTPEKTSIAVLKFIEKLSTRYPEVKGLYSTEDRIDNGVFSLEANDPTRCNARTAVIWENAVLFEHYSPAIVKGVKSLFVKSKEEF